MQHQHIKKSEQTHQADSQHNSAKHAHRERLDVQSAGMPLYLQRQPVEEEEELLQPKPAGASIQRQPLEEEEELLQPKRKDGVVQRQPLEEEEEMLQPSRSDSPIIQAKLTIGAPDDEYEREADRVADQVMAMPDAKLQRQPGNEEEERLQARPLSTQITPLIQRQVEPEEEEELIQAKSDVTVAPQITAGIARDIHSLKDAGQPLATSERAFFESRFGTDFSHVCVHTDDRAARASQSINARAFTLGRDVVFGSGQYSPGSSADRKLLAHELTHVVQQSGRHLPLNSLSTDVKSDEPIIRRTSVAEAELTVLRAALLEAIRTLRGLTQAGPARTRLIRLRDRLPAMGAAEMRRHLQTLQSAAARAVTRTQLGAQRLTPRSTPSLLDPIMDDADRVIREGRRHELYLLHQVIRRSRSHSGRNIKRMLRLMRTSLQQIRWFAANNVGFTAAQSFLGASGSPPSARFEIYLGPSMLVMMNRPSEEMLPVLAHEVYHAYETFRRMRRGALPARTNLSEEEMNRRIGMLAGTSRRASMSYGGDARTFSRTAESELLAELIQHSGYQDPAMRRHQQRTIHLGSHLASVGDRQSNEADIRMRLRQIDTLFGATDGKAIALRLLARVRSERFFHPNSRTFLQQQIAAIFP